MTMLELKVNDRAVHKAVEPRTHLADFLRDGLDLTGTHLGCEHGVCGACTILIDNVPARSCITFAVTCGGAAITTIEGLDDDPITTELRAAFTREHALQCGYCTPGMLVSARDLVLRLDAPDDHRIRVGLSGNLCRCTGYVGIVRAVKSVIAERRARGITAVPDGGRSTLGPAGSGHAIAASLPSTIAIPHIADPASVIADIPDFTPATVIQQSFKVPHPPETVFAFFDDIAAVASCLPGATLTGTPTPARVDGAFRAKVGPISASFEGAARIERDPATRSGRIIGIGRDFRSRSQTQGEIRYRVLPIEDGTSTRVELSIGYSLRGMLAQIGRSGLIRDLAARLIAEFAGNLDKRLSGGAAHAAIDAPAADLNLVSLVVGLIRQRAASLLRKWGGKSGGGP